MKTTDALLYLLSIEALQNLHELERWLLCHGWRWKGVQRFQGRVEPTSKSVFRYTWPETTHV